MLLARDADVRPQMSGKRPVASHSVSVAVVLEPLG